MTTSRSLQFQLSDSNRVYRIQPALTTHALLFKPAPHHFARKYIVAVSVYPGLSSSSSSSVHRIPALRWNNFFHHQMQSNYQFQLIETSPLRSTYLMATSTYRQYLGHRDPTPSQSLKSASPRSQLRSVRETSTSTFAPTIGGQPVSFPRHLCAPCWWWHVPIAAKRGAIPGAGTHMNEGNLEWPSSCCLQVSGNACFSLEAGYPQSVFMNPPHGIQCSVIFMSI